jgi:hypothetical protein
MPSTWGGISTYKNILGESGLAKLENWIENGGTLIALNGAAAFLADSSSGLSQVQLKSQSMDNLDLFVEALERDSQADENIDSLVIWGDKMADAKKEVTKTKLEKEKLKSMDERGRLFMPRGTIMNAQLDREHWMNYGAGSSVPVTIYSSYAYLSKRPVETTARFAPEQKLRLSGLLWPEAKKRWANTAYATRERKGLGQIILLTNEPSYRSYFYGSTRLLLNAILLGPGMGTNVGVDW